MLELFCRALVLVFKDSGEVKAGRADVFVDGVKKLTADPHINGWIHCNPVILIQEKEAKKHVVQVRMSAGREKRVYHSGIRLCVSPFIDKEQLKCYNPLTNVTEKRTGES